MAEYLAERLVPEAFVSALARPGAVRETVTNLYIINRAANVAREINLSSAEEEDWQCRNAANRFALGKLTEHETDVKAAEVDWEQLAREQYLLEFNGGTATREVAVSHILISSETRSFDEMVRRTELIRDALKDGRAFDLVAMEYSDDESVSLNKGNLGYVKRGKTHPAFEQSAYGMERIGDVSDPVITSFGFHIIRLEGVRDREPLPFESVKDSLIKTLKKQHVAIARRATLEPFRQEIQPYLGDINEAEVAARLLDRLMVD